MRTKEVLNFIKKMIHPCNPFDAEILSKVGEAELRAILNILVKRGNIEQNFYKKMGFQSKDRPRLLPNNLILGYGLGEQWNSQAS